MPPLFAVDILQMHVEGTEAPLPMVTIETSVLDVLDGTPRYLVVSDLERIVYPPLTLLISQRMEFPNEEIVPDCVVAEEEYARYLPQYLLLM